MNIAKFIQNSIKLNDKPIKLYKYQKDFLNDMNDFRIVVKSRQIGLTQTIAWEALAYAIYNPNELIIIVSASMRNATDVMKYVSNAFHSLPKGMKMEVKETKEEIIFENRSRIMSLPNNPRTVRGRPATRIYVDEFAMFQDDETMWEAIMPSITRGGKATLISTPKGKRGKFYEFWENAEKNGWNKYYIPWQQCPDIKKRIKIIKQGMPDELSFRQEFCCDFIDEAISYFSYELLMDCVDDDLENNVEKDKLPTYAGVDYGKVTDSSVITVVKKEDYDFRLVFIKEFKPPLAYKEVAKYILRNHKEWGVDRIVVDQTGVGEGTIEMLSELGSLLVGEKLTQPFKEKIIANLKMLMEDGKLKIPRNETLLLQLHALQRVVSDSGNTSFRHPSKGKVQHDDYVWALALAVYQGTQGGTGGLPVFTDSPVFGVSTRNERPSFPLGDY